MNKKIAALGAIAVALLFLSSTASAQTTGTVVLNGTVAAAIQLHFHDSTAIGGATETTKPAHDAALAYVVDLGNVGAANTNTWVGAEVQVMIRSNYGTNTTLSLQRTAGSGFGASPSIRYDDVGIGVGTIACHNVNPLCNSAPTVAGSWSNTPDIAGNINADGVATFPTDLADLATNTLIVTFAGRISTGGGLASQNNAVVVPIRYVVHPQFFAVNAGFSATITYTVAGT
jgi:hypothetical protein